MTARAERPVTLPVEVVRDLREYLARADAILGLPHTPDRLRERHAVLTEMAAYLRTTLDRLAGGEG